MADVLGIPLGGCVQNVRHEFIHEAIGFYHRPSVPIGLWSPYCWSPSPLSPKKYQIHWVASLKPQTNSTRYNLDLTFGMAMERYGQVQKLDIFQFRSSMLNHVASGLWSLEYSLFRQSYTCLHSFLLVLDSEFSKQYLAILGCCFGISILDKPIVNTLCLLEHAGAYSSIVLSIVYIEHIPIKYSYNWILQIHPQCGNPKNKPIIWRWFIAPKHTQTRHGNFGDGLWSGLYHVSTPQQAFFVWWCQYFKHISIIHHNHHIIAI